MTRFRRILTRAAITTLCTAAFVITAATTVAQTTAQPAGETPASQYAEFRAKFAKPDHARWGEVPLWWWEGDRLTKERLRWQLETLAAQGVKSVCPIQRSPARCDPASFTPQWWDTFTYVHDVCRELGMTLWAYDQIGYGHYGWLEMAAGKVQDAKTARLAFLTADAQPDAPVRLEVPKGRLLAARAYPLEDGLADDAASRDVSDSIEGQELVWTPSHGTWRVAVSVAVPEPTFQLSEPAAEEFLDMLYGEVERRVGKEAMGKSFAGMFQDEHPPTPRDVFTDRLGERFQERWGYDIARAIPALHFDVGKLTPKYRSDFFDVYLAEDERCYWKRVYDWTAERGVLTSHDNWGRNNIETQSRGYIDYFRTQRWFSAPGYDDSGQAPVARRNYYDTKIAASLARLYRRPRVWSEAFHSSGWGRTTDQTLSWLSANYLFGANLYDEHGLYYSARASTWEHAAPDPHWRQPYWRYYHAISDWVARMSYVMGQGDHVVDAAVHYPVVSLLAGDPPDGSHPNYNEHMQLSRSLFDATIDNDIIDDDSILAAEIDNGKLQVAGNAYRGLVFGRERTMRRSVLRKAVEFARSGGCVVFYGRLPTASTEAGRGDPELKRLLEQLFDTVLSGPPAEALQRQFAEGGLAAFVPQDPSTVVSLVGNSMVRDVTPQGSRTVYATHRRIGELDVYLLQNPDTEPLELAAAFRVDGVPEIWSAFTGEVEPVDWFRRDGERTHVRFPLEGNVARLLVFRPGDARRAAHRRRLPQPAELQRKLPDRWEFSVIPTRDNRWGEFRWPPSDELIGPEVRVMKYCVEPSGGTVTQPWQNPVYDDKSWKEVKYSTGPHWLCAAGLPAGVRVAALVERGFSEVAPGSSLQIEKESYPWQEVGFSQTIGLARPTPWGGHSGYPDGAIDRNFIELPPGRKLLFTRIVSPRERRLGLRIELRNSSARVWVNGQEQPIVGAVANLPLQEGANPVLIELPDGGRGRLYVQETPPAARTMKEAEAKLLKPPFAKAHWIQAAESGSGYVRKVFRLNQKPLDARLVLTGYTGYRLFINGRQVEEDIGPWAKWTHPESLNITPYLQSGPNVIAVWLQVHSGQHVRGDAEDQALALAMRAKLPSGETVSLTSDGSWKGTVRLREGWEKLAFDDADWKPVTVVGPMGTEPYGNEPLEKVGAVTEPRRRLAINLPAPYLTCFQEVPDIAYDVRPGGEVVHGWFRFPAPPGLQRLHLFTSAAVEVWVDGVKVPVEKGVATVQQTPSGVSQVAMRVAMEPGRYAGAVFRKPIALELGGGTIQTGLWANYALPTYSGIGVYRQQFELTADEAKRPTELDLGEVLVAAEVLVNGKSAGTRLARPFRFDITSLIQQGKNELEIRVANTLAPHYTRTNRSTNLGPTDSGLLGPVTLQQRLRH